MVEALVKPDSVDRAASALHLEPRWDMAQYGPEESGEEGEHVLLRFTRQEKED